MIPFGIPAALGALKALGLGGALATVKSRLTGPVVMALGIGVLALGIVIGIAWLVMDAKSDVRAGVMAQCNADKLADRLRQAEAREKAQADALVQRDLEAARLRGQAKSADEEVERLKTEMGDLRAKSTAAVRDRACLPADDPWLRQGRPAAPAAAPGR